MSFDGIFTMAMATHLDKQLRQGKVHKIYQPSSFELIFHIYANGKKHQLYINVKGNDARMHLTQLQRENPSVPYPFTMALRKHLTNSRIRTISQYKSERIIEITFDTFDEMGYEIEKKLVIEIMGRHSNVSLINSSNNQIIHVLKPLSIDTNSARPMLPSLPYEYPPVQDKIPFKDFMSAKDYPFFNDGKKLSGEVGGISLKLANLIYDLYLTKTQTGFITKTSNSFASFAQKFIKETCCAIEEGSAMSYLERSNGNLSDFHIVSPSTNLDGIITLEPCDSPSTCCETYFEGITSSNLITLRSNKLNSQLKSLLKKSQRKELAIQKDLEKAEKSKEFRIFGELLTTYMYKINTGSKCIELENYYDNSMIKIQLDPKLSPSENAQRYFSLFNKGKRTLIKAKSQLKDVQQQIEYLKTLLASLELARSIDDIKAIEEEALTEGLIKNKHQKKITTNKKDSYKPHKYMLDSGLVVYVGRNNIENHRLSLKEGKKTDLWFHTKDIHGSHAVLSIPPGYTPSEEDLKQSAAIAAFHSQGRFSNNVPVDYTYLRYVKKPSGAKPGMVIFTNNKTIWIDPALPDNVNNSDK